MKSSQAPGGPEEPEQPSPFAGLPAYPEHEEGAPAYSDMPPPSYGSAVMRYEITQKNLLQKGQLSIFDDSGTLQFTAPGNRSICDPSGYELATTDPHPFGRQVDILRNGWVVASVHEVDLGSGRKFRIDGPAGQFTAEGGFFSHNYTLTGPGAVSYTHLTLPTN